MQQPRERFPDHIHYRAAWSELRTRCESVVSTLVMFLIFTLFMGAYVYLNQFMGRGSSPVAFPQTPLGQGLLLGGIGGFFLLVFLIPLWGARAGFCTFPCPRCGRPFFGWKPRRRFLRRRTWAVIWRRFQHGPRHGERRKSGQACRYCSLPLWAKAEEQGAGPSRADAPPPQHRLH